MLVVTRMPWIGALRGALLHVICTMCMAGAIPVIVTDPPTEMFDATPRAPRAPENHLVNPERQQHTDWSHVALDGGRLQSGHGDKVGKAMAPVPEEQGSEVAARCHHCQAGRSENESENARNEREREKEAEVRRTMCSSQFAIGGRVVGSNRTHYRLQVFGVFKAGAKPIYGMMAYRNPRSSTLRPPPASASASSAAAASASSVSSRGAQPAPNSDQHADEDDELAPPREFLLLKAPRADGEQAPPCQPCPMRVGRNYFVAGRVRGDSFVLTADSTVFRWKRKVRQFVEAATADGGYDC